MFGLFLLALTTFEVTSRLAVFGLDKSLLKFVPEANNREDALYSVLSSSLRLGLLLTVPITAILFAIAPLLATAWFEKPELVAPLRILSVSLLPWVLLQVFLSATKGLKIMVYDALIAGLLHPFLLLIFSVPILWTSIPVQGLSIAYSAATLVAFFCALFCFSKHFSLPRALRTVPGHHFRDLFHFSLPLGILDVIQYTGSRLDVLILASFVSGQSLGIYFLAVEFANVIRKFRQICDPMLIPILSGLQHANQPARVQDNLTRAMRWILILGVAYVGIIALFGSTILSLMGKTFTQGDFLLIILCGAQLIHANTGLLELAFLASGRPKINLINACILLVFQFGLYLWLIPALGTTGAAWSTLLAIVLIGIVRFAEAYKILNILPLSLKQFKPVLAGLVAAGLAIALREYLIPENWVGFVVFIVAYPCALIVFGLEEEDKNILRRNSTPA